MARILVAYASWAGSTKEIAATVGKELDAAGHAADVREMGEVTGLSGYNAVVIGAPMYMGRMVGTKKFVRRYRAILETMPIAGFAVCLAAAGNDPSAIELMHKTLKNSLAPLNPVAVTLFAGKLDPARLSWFQRWIVHRVKAPVGDFRDWMAISIWARGLPDLMLLVRNNPN